MMTSIRTLSLAVLLAVFLAAPAGAQPKKLPPVDANPIGLNSVLPLNPAVRTGRLDNGLAYFILRNAMPEKRAELRLAVNAGSVLEADDQQGLAHFCEHMCFNGTRNFDHDALVRYMESIGMRFGADVNAGTSLDQTVYMLQIPTDRPDIIENGFQILRDWAHDVTFEDAEIDKERGVIIEEMRLYKGAAQRVRDQQLPVVYHGSKYAERMPIGKEHVLTSFPYATLKRFYTTWYRPDLMAVVVVGDVDVDATEKLIRAKFSTIPKPSAPAQRPVIAMPDHRETLYSIVADPEVTTTSLTLTTKFDPRPLVKGKDYRDALIDRLIDGMTNNRLDELTRLADPPYLSASSSYGRMVRSKDAFNLRVGVSGNDVARGYEAALTELQRARLHGFTATELERAKTAMLRRTEERYNERDKTESRRLASGLVDYYLTGEAETGIEIEYALQQKFLKGITINEINARLKERSVDGNTVITVTLPEKEGVRKPEEQELRAIAEAVAKRTLEPYLDVVANKPLVEPPANTTDIAAEQAIPELGVTEWRLSNGVRVIVKPTQFKNEEILFAAFSPGGSSLVDEGDQLSATLAAAVMTSSGVGEFSLTELKKILTGKVATVQPSIGELQEGFSGSVAPKDLETMFQLVYLYFTAPRRDEAAYQALSTQMRTMLQNAGRQPESVFRDTVAVTMAQYHPRRRPLTLERLDELNLDRAYETFKDRFADAGDFTFIFVGNVNLEAFRPLVLRYFGSLPVTGRKETWRDLGVRPPDGVVEKTVRKGIEKKSTVQFRFMGPFEWNAQNRYEFASLMEILRMRLREQVREEKGGTYGVQVMGEPEHYPNGEYRIIINFGCNPDRVEELTATTISVLKEIVEKGVAQEYVDKTKEIQRRERETNLKENRFWLGRLQQSYVNDEDPRDILQYNARVDALTTDAIQRAATQYLDLNHYARFVLLPE